MLRALVEPVDDRKVSFLSLSGQEEAIDRRVGHAHLGLVGLPLEETGRRSLVNDALRRVQIAENS